MANKITNDDIININEAYLELKTYAATARKLGFSAGTIKKYVIPNYTSQKHIKTIPCKGIPEKGSYTINWDLRLSDEEIKEIKELWNEITI